MASQPSMIPVDTTPDGIPEANAFDTQVKISTEDNTSKGHQERMSQVFKRVVRESSSRLRSQNTCPKPLFVCTACESSFYSRNKLKRHLQTVHVDGKSCQCGECGKRIKHEHNIKRHICDQCCKIVVVNEMESTASYVVAGRELLS